MPRPDDGLDLPEEHTLPPIEQLTARDPGPDRAPGELAARVRAFMGEADPLPAWQDPLRPDVSDLRGELGL